MSGFTSFISDSKVHDTVLWTMVVTSFLAAIRRFKIIDNTPIAPGFYTKIKLFWNFIYDWITGFWSLRTGQTPPTVATQHTQTSEQTPTTSKIEDTTFTSVPDPTSAVTSPPQTK